MLKQTIETQLTKLKMLVRHTPQVATPSTVQNVVMDPEGNRHRFILVTPISKWGPSAQEGMQKGLQKGVAQLDLAALPSETLRTLQVQITEEFNGREHLVRAENVALRKEQDKIERKYHKAIALATQRKQDEVSMKRSMAELCLELPDMQLEPDASVLENV